MIAPTSQLSVDSKKDNLGRVLYSFHAVSGVNVVGLNATAEALYERVTVQVPHPFHLSQEATALLVAKTRGDGGSRCVHASTADGLEYVALQIDRADLPSGTLILGPFVTKPVNNEWVSQIMAQKKLPPIAHGSVLNFFSSLLLAESNLPWHLAQTVKGLVTQSIGKITLEPVLIGTEMIFGSNGLLGKSFQDKDAISTRYNLEHDLRLAITTGNRQLLDHLLKESESLRRLPDRFTDNPLRSAKNLSFVLNTLLRVAAAEGKVQVLYLHEISERFAIAIEKSNTLAEINGLQSSMVNSYFDLVQTHRREGITPHLAEVLNYIDVNLQDDLRLCTMAHKFGMSASNLANQVRQQVNLTLSGYVNQQRTNAAVWYLNNSKLKIKQISALVGFADVTWFARSFRKVQGVSATEFRKTIGEV